MSSPEPRVAVRRQHSNTPPEAQDRDVERAAAEVACDRVSPAASSRTRAPRPSARSRAAALEPASLPRRASPGAAVVEVGRHRRRRARRSPSAASAQRLSSRSTTADTSGACRGRRRRWDDTADDTLSGGTEDRDCRTVLVRHVLWVEAYEGLHREDRVERQLGGHRLRPPADDDLTVREIRHRGRQQHLARLRIREAARHALLHHGDEAVRRPEVDADDARHQTPSASSTSSTSVSRYAISERRVLSSSSTAGAVGSAASHAG